MGVFFSTKCWLEFSPDVLKCGLCRTFGPRGAGAVCKETFMWNCNDCRSQFD